MQIEQTILRDQLKNRNCGPQESAMAIANYTKNTVDGASGQSDGISFQKSEEELGIFAKNNINPATYGKPEKEKDTLAQEIEKGTALSAQERRNQIAVVANTVSSQDLAELQEQGFSVDDMDTDTIITVTDKIKAVMAEAGAETAGSSLSEEELAEIMGSQIRAREIAQAMEQADIPATDANIQDAGKALEQVQSLSGIHDSAMAYLLKNELPPTIQNIYKAQHSGMGTKTVSSIEHDTGMDAQICRMIEESGLQADEEMMADAHWLLENQIDLTQENLTYLQELQELSETLTNAGDNWDQSLMDSITRAVREGDRPQDAYLVPGYSKIERAKAAMDTITSATREHLEALVDQNETVTIAGLRRVMKQAEAEGKDTVELWNLPAMEGSDDAKQLYMITARRQLEEVRLAMTTQANYALYKKGISIDTMPLSDLVEELKSQEKALYQSMLTQNGMEATSERVNCLADTTRMVSELKIQPAYLLTLHSGEETIPKLHEAGRVLSDVFAKANASYEALMTSPRKDMGDSIQKAFRNVDDILTDLGMELSEGNQRAVRILAYNQTEINGENIQRMKAVDEEVQRTFSNLTPRVTLELIRSGQNPLDMPIHELNEAAQKISSSQPDREPERFSKFLYQLEQNHEISEEERSGYIGIYRLIAQVEKSDGAAIGFLVNQGAEPTMRNLLSAVRSARKGEMEYTVDDDFAGVSAKENGLRIDDQINAAFQMNCLHDAADHISPQGLAGITQEEILEMTPEEIRQMLYSAGYTQQEKQTEQAYANEKLAQYREAMEASEDVYQFLDRYGISNSVLNVVAASRMMKSPTRMFEELWKGATPETVRGLKQQVLERFGEAIKTPEEMAEAQEALAEVAEHAMDNMIIEDHTVRSGDIRTLRILGKQFTFAARRATEENYVIPVQTGDEITGVSLKIVRGKEEKGLVEIFFDSDPLGKVIASFEAKEKGFSGMLVTDNRQTQEKLRDFLDEIAQFVGEEEESINLNVTFAESVSFERYQAAIGQRETQLRQETNFEGNHRRFRDDTVTDQGADTTDAQAVKNPVQTSRLYRIAEGFLQIVRKIE